MGYTFTIGNATPEFTKDEYGLWARWVVAGATSPEAPTFPNDGMTGNSNERSPGYSAWAGFCREAGLYDFFYDERGRLHAGHPGCIQITEADHAVVKVALDRCRARATLPPGFSGWGKYNEQTGEYETPDEGKYDATLARLIWLEWWMRWALDNCETPAIQNT